MCLHVLPVDFEYPASYLLPVTHGPFDFDIVDDRNLSCIQREIKISTDPFIYLRCLVEGVVFASEEGQGQGGGGRINGGRAGGKE
jgi:hypothetical protein